jgi:adenosylcobinamide-GDP ribazoletransferase
LSAQADPAARPQNFARRGWDGLASAVTFLTVLPLPANTIGEFDLRAGVVWFPAVGALVGAIAGGVRAAFDPLVGRGPSTALAMIALVVVTGALHQDALADTADGLGVQGDAERRIQVMRDSRVGAFGVLALIGWALLMFSSLEQAGSRHALLILIAAGAAGRLAAPLQGLIAPPSRPDGLGSRMTPSPNAVLAAAVIAAAILAAAVGLARGGVALAVALAAAALTGWMARRMLGGITGDTLGAAVALTEVCVCVALVPMWH